ncbi:DNA-binding protein [Brevibacterium renqingii]|uniref:DNA-binding protein n=1 Tax=Brevibacterium renqingii TaxID=2776916 RepID=UPI003458D46C
MARTRVHSQFVSLDGFSAGEFVTFDEPIGEAGRLFSHFDCQGIDGVHTIDGPITLDRTLFALWGQGIGAEIMGRRKFGPQTGPWPDDGWRGWWGGEPPFRTPCFVLTHHPRDPLEFENGTTFHFVDAGIDEVLAMAYEAAGGLDVRIGGGHRRSGSSWPPISSIS